MWSCPSGHLPKYNECQVEEDEEHLARKVQLYPYMYFICPISRLQGGRSISPSLPSLTLYAESMHSLIL